MRPVILEMGFERSGTTLLRRLLCQHPDVSHILHEAKTLNLSRNRENVEAQAIAIAKKKSVSLDTQAGWGNKMPFLDNPERFIAYYKRWRELFGDRARVIVIVRHPYDVALSAQRTFDRKTLTTLQSCCLTLPAFLREANADGLHILKFESLVAKPEETLEEILCYCGLRAGWEIISDIINSKRSELRYFDGIESSRAFAHTREHVVFPLDDGLDNLFTVLNKVPGPVYEGQG